MLKPRVTPRYPPALPTREDTALAPSTAANSTATVATANPTVPLLQIEHLDIHFRTDRGVARVVDDCNLTIGRGEIVGIAGESGSGKTTLVEAILQIIRFPNRVTGGRVLFSPDGGPPVDLMRLDSKAMRRYRGHHLAYVPQGSMNSLNPISRIGDQIVETMEAHGVRRPDARRKVPDLLDQMGLDERVARLYPHELSGGMKQRAIIATAIAMGPALIVADEPTTALDVNVQRRILESLLRLREERGIAVLIVSHDLPVHVQLADRIGVMYAGQVVEAAPIHPAVKTPMHPYTAGLIASIPAIGGVRQRLEGIGGATPSPLSWPTGCRFNNRCPHAMDICRETPPRLATLSTGERDGLTGRVTAGANHQVACHLYEESREGAR